MDFIAPKYDNSVVAFSESDMSDSGDGRGVGTAKESMKGMEKGTDTGSAELIKTPSGCLCSSEEEDILFPVGRGRKKHVINDSMIEESSTAMTVEDPIVQQEDSLLDSPLSTRVTSVPRTHQTRQRSHGSKGLLMFSKRTLFTYTSPYINNRIDINEYDRSRLEEGIMLNDSIVNFYMNYTLTEHIRDRLRLHAIAEEEAETLLRKEHLSDSLREEHVRKVLNEELLTFHVFSTFLYPQLGKLRRIDNAETKKKLKKWCENAAVFQRRCVFFPLFQHHFSLAVLLYPNKLLQYIRKKRIVNGINYAWSRKSSSSVVNSGLNDLMPCLVLMDSLHDDASGTECANIRLLLSLLLHDSFPDCEVDITEYNLPMLAPRVPKQRNAVDCGVFTLGFTRLIMNHFGELRVYAGAAKNSELADSAFAFLYKEVDTITTLRMRIKMLISQIANSSRASDCFAVDDDAETSDIECVEVKLANGNETSRSGSKERTKESKVGTVRKGPLTSSVSSMTKMETGNAIKPSIAPSHSCVESSKLQPIPSTQKEQPVHSSPKQAPTRVISDKTTYRSSDFKTNVSTQNPPSRATSSTHRLSAFLQSFESHVDPVQVLKPEASLYGETKRDRNWHVSDKATKEQKAKKRKGFDYVPQNTL